MNLQFMRRVRERERAIRQFATAKNKLMSVCNASVLLIEDALRHNIVKLVFGSTSAIASSIHSYFDTVMAKFMINNSIDA